MIFIMNWIAYFLSSIGDSKAGSVCLDLGSGIGFFSAMLAGYEGNQVYVDMIVSMPKGADSPEAQACVDRWRKHMDYFWTPNLEQLLDLVIMYGQSPAFKANFDKMHPELADFFREAATVYIATRK